METMAHGWFLVAAIIATAVLGLASMACAFVAWGRPYSAAGWGLTGLALRALSAIAGGVTLLSIVLNVIRYAKGGA